MLWYHSNHDGTCEAHQDSPTIRTIIDACGGRDWYGSAEGAVMHGGVRACAFRQRTEQTYDAITWLRTRQLVHMGERIITTRGFQRD